MLRILTFLFLILTANTASASLLISSPSYSEVNGQYRVVVAILVSGTASHPADWGYTGPGTYMAADGYRITSATLHFSAPDSNTPSQTVSGINSTAPPLIMGAEFYYSQPGTYEIAYFYGANFQAGVNSAFVTDEDGTTTFSSYRPSFMSSESGSGTIEVVIAAVPELSTWIMMTLGFAGAGFIAYRHRKLSSTVLS